MARSTPHRLANPALDRHTGDERDLGQRAADAIARKAGSWVFVFSFLAFLAVWMACNDSRVPEGFDRTRSSC